MERGPSTDFRITVRTIFIRLSIKVKTQDFWKDGREATDRGRGYVRKIVGKFSEIFRKDLKRWIITFLAEFSISLQ